MEMFEVILEGSGPYGFRLTGGVDCRMPMRIAKVTEGSLAAKSPLSAGQRIVKINGKSTSAMPQVMAQSAVLASKRNLSLTLYGKMRSPLPQEDQNWSEALGGEANDPEDDTISVDSWATTVTDIRDNPCPKTVPGVTRSIYKRGRFRGPWKTDFDEVQHLKMKLTENDPKLPSKKVLCETLPVVTPDFEEPCPDAGLRVTWLGHNTLLVEMDGLTILTDPVFSSTTGLFKSSTFQWHKRYRPSPCKIKELPKIDAVIISNNHYDSLDYKSVRDLNWRFKDSLHWFIPAGLQHWFRFWIGCKNVHELDWGEEESIPDRPDIRFIFTPSQGWSGREVCDKDQSLWGGWCVIGLTKRFYFVGETGYCEAFKETGELFGPFDLAAIPIGGYGPKWFFGNHRTTPSQALRIHRDIKSNKSIGIHWGTFPQGNEPYMEPREDLKKCLKKRGVSSDAFVTVSHGETMTLEEPVASAEDPAVTTEELS
ncbi:N-acyl-phosphatidylethanolamine-hydrolyzing phospholipase D-like [Amphiura filiformis]|uniref:N-acyl-phosphatidylethanolamine-hydrolyzing phospholipase D-like n=1 Tax=Amphiura filiformis TaxID=82378 RepID=UPI003B20D960